jgi:hypothetical protein
MSAENAICTPYVGVPKAFATAEEIGINKADKITMSQLGKGSSRNATAVLIVIVHQGSSHGHPDMNCRTISSPRFGSVLPLVVFTGDIYVNFSGGSGEQCSRSSALADIHPRFCV